MEVSGKSSIQTIEIVMNWPLGFHLRPVARFVKYARQFRSAIRIKKGKITADGKNIMGLLLLAIAWKSKIHIEAEGDDAEEAIEGISAFFSTREKDK